MMELLKQDQYSPMPIEDQIMVLFFATREDYIKDIAVEDIDKTGVELIQFMHEAHPQILEQIRKDKELSPQLEAELHNAILEFKNK